MFEYDLLSNIWFGVLGLVWAIYLTQDMFVMGASMLNGVIAKKDEGLRKQIQVASGIHSDGIEVWLILALGGTFAAFPLAFATTLESLYIPFFLLLYALTMRKMAIELIYKDDTKTWVSTMSVVWVVSSGLLMFILGVYMTNVFLGFKLDSTGYVGHLFSIFNTIGLLGGLLFVSMALVSGAMYLNLSTSGEVPARALKYARIPAGLVALLPTFILQGLNNKSVLFKGILFTDYKILWALPALMIVFGLVTLYATLKEKVILSFVSVSLVMALYIALGFFGTFPYLVPSSIDSMYGVSIELARASHLVLKIMFVVALILVPLVIGYQTFKYVYFAKKVHPNDQ